MQNQAILSVVPQRTLFQLFHSDHSVRAESGNVVSCSRTTRYNEYYSAHTVGCLLDSRGAHTAGSSGQQSNQVTLLTPVSQRPVLYAVAEAGTQVTPQLQSHAESAREDQ